VVAETLASTAISTAFVGTVTASLVLAEVLRGLHGGRRYDTLSLQLGIWHIKKLSCINRKIP